MQPIERERGRELQLKLDLPRDLELERKLQLERELELEIEFFRGRRQRAQPFGSADPERTLGQRGVGQQGATCIQLGVDE